MALVQPPHLDGVSPPPAAADPPFQITIIVIGLATALDMAVGTVMFAVLVALVTVPVGIVRVMRITPRTRARALLALGLAVLAPVVAFGAVIGNLMHARAVSGDVVDAVHAFHAREGRWPAELVELTARDLPRIPRAKYTLFLGGFDYYAPPSRADAPAPSEPAPGPILDYVVYPPFMRSVYSFERREWSTLD